MPKGKQPGDNINGKHIPSELAALNESILDMMNACSQYRNELLVRLTQRCICPCRIGKDLGFGTESCTSDFALGTGQSSSSSSGR